MGCGHPSSWVSFVKVDFTDSCFLPLWLPRGLLLPAWGLAQELYLPQFILNVLNNVCFILGLSIWTGLSQ